MSGFHPYQAVLRQQLEERQGSVELVLLEAAWKDDSLKCECDHEESRCSVKVTHRVIACNADVLLCANAADMHRRAMKDPTAHCHGCQALVSLCWRLVAV